MDLRTAGHQDDVGPVTLLPGQHICPFLQLLGRSGHGPVDHRDLVSGENDHRRSPHARKRDTKGLERLARIRGAQDTHVRHRPERSQMLNGLMRRAVFTQADGVVTQDIDHGQLHQGRQADGRPRVVGEDEKRRSKRPDSAVQRHPRAGRAHHVLAHAPAYVTSLIAALAEVRFSVDDRLG